VPNPFHCSEMGIVGCIEIVSTGVNGISQYQAVYAEQGS